VQKTGIFLHRFIVRIFVLAPTSRCGHEACGEV
jgi:hypothetical protein